MYCHFSLSILYTPLIAYLSIFSLFLIKPISVILAKLLLTNKAVLCSVQTSYFNDNISFSTIPILIIYNKKPLSPYIVFYFNVKI